MPESVQLPLEGRLVNQRKLERQVASVAKKAGRNLKIDLGTNAKDIKSLEQPLGRITGQADEFGKSMQAANARVIAFGASVGIINAVVQSFKSLVTTTIEVEASLSKINSILNTTVSGLDALKGQIFDIARNTQQTFDTVAEAALELSRQGLGATEVTKRLNDALILSRLSGISAADAVAGLTAAVNSFSKEGLTTSAVLNKISNAANQFAVSERDLIEGFKRSASVAQQAGVSLDELGGIITAVQQKTARGGAVIGNSFKTIFTRIGRSENLKLLESLGVQIVDVQGKILPATKLIENLAGKLESLNDVQVRSITEKIGGGFQIAPLLAALDDYSSETSIAIQATEAFATATDQAYKKNIILNDTLSAAITRTGLTIKELANNLGELGVTDTFKELLNIVNNFAGKINEILDGDSLGSKFVKGFLGGLSGALIKGGLAIFGVLLFQLSKQLLKFGVDSFKTFLGLNKEAERLKSIQAQIVSTLISDKGIREQILRIENSSLSAEDKRLQQAAFFNTALKERIGLTSQLNSISGGIAPNITGTSRRRSAKRAAGGFLPVGAEQKDISNGVGGAPSGAKPVVIPNFAFGNGKKGTMVANSSEYIVPNFAGGGSAIYNQDMVKSMGLPTGAKKINAAGGFIPNFAGKNANTGKDLVLLTGSDGPDTNPSFFVGKGPKGDTRAYDSMAEATKQGLQKELVYKVSVPTYQSKKPRGDKGGASFIGGLEKSIRQLGADEAVRTSKEIGSPTDLNGRKANDLKSRFQKGAVNSLSGSIFEIALASLLEDPQFQDFSDRTENSRIDLPKSENLYGAFGVKPGDGGRGAEVKGSNSKDLQQSAAKKFFDVLVGKEAAFGFQKGSKSAKRGNIDRDAAKKKYNITDKDFALLGGSKNKPVPVTVFDGLKKRSASGYIPNFAQNQSPLEEAIGRERQAGIPINQIRVNQDGGLRNSKNPEGLAITNTRDEPTGAVPKNASRGFVPNFVGQEMAASAAKANENAIKNQTKATQDLTKGTQGQAAASEKSTASFLKYSALLYLAQGAIGGMANEAEGATKGFVELLQSVSVASSVLFGLKSLGADVGLKAKSKESFNEKIDSSEDGSFFKKQKEGLKKAQDSFSKVKDGKGVGGLAKKLGPLAKLNFAKLALGFGRFLPLIGTAVTVLPILNTALKKITGGFDAFNFVLGGLKKFGQLVGLIDKPAQAAAKALEKLSESAIDAAIDPSKDAFSSVDAQIRNLELVAKGLAKGDDGEALNTAQIIQKALGGTKDNKKDINTQTQIAADTGLISLLSKKDKEALSKAPEDIKKFVDAQLKRLGSGDAGKRQSLIGEEGVLRGKLEAAQQSKDTVAEEAINNQLKLNLETRNAIEKKLLDEAKAADQVLKIEEGRKRILGEIANTRIKSVLDQQKALAAIKTEAQFALEIRKASSDTGQSDDADIENRLKNLQVEKDLQQQVADIFSKRILSNKSVQNVLAPDVSRTVDSKVYEDISSFVLQINDALLTGAELEGKILQFAELRLGQVDGIQGKQKEIVGIIKEEITAATKLALIAKSNNDLESARLKIINAQTAAEKRRDDIRDRGFKRSRDQEDRALKVIQQQLDLDRERFKESRAGGGKRTTSDVRAENAFDKRQTNLNIQKDESALKNSFKDTFLSELKSFSNIIDPGQRRGLEKRIEGASTGDLPSIETAVNRLIDVSIKNQEVIGKKQEDNAKKRLEALKGAITNGLKNGFGGNVKLFGGSVEKFGEYINKALLGNAEDRLSNANSIVNDPTRNSRIKELTAAGESYTGKSYEAIDKAKESIARMGETIVEAGKKIDAQNKRLSDVKKGARRGGAYAKLRKEVNDNINDLEGNIDAARKRITERTEFTDKYGAAAQEDKENQTELNRLINERNEASKRAVELEKTRLGLLQEQTTTKPSQTQSLNLGGSPAQFGTGVAETGAALANANVDQKEKAEGTGQALGELTTTASILNALFKSLTLTAQGLLGQQQKGEFKAPFLPVGEKPNPLKDAANKIGKKPNFTNFKVGPEVKPSRSGEAIIRKREDADFQKTLQTLKASAALKDFTGSLKTLASLIRSEFENIREQRAQNTFDILTTADAGTLQSAGTSEGRLDTLQNAGGTEIDRIRQANEYVLRREKELAVLRDISTASRSQLEYEYQINLKILALREKVNAAKTTGERDAILNEAAELEAQKQNPSIGELFKRQGKSPEESAREIKELLVSASSDFVDTLSDGLVDSLSKGESLRDTLREAATGFLDELAKKSLNNLLRGVVFGGGDTGLPGIFGNIFGDKSGDETSKTGITGSFGAGSSLMNSSKGLSANDPLYFEETGGLNSGEKSSPGGADGTGALVSATSSLVGKDVSAIASFLGLGGGKSGPRGTENNPIYVSDVSGGGSGGAAGTSTGGSSGFGNMISKIFSKVGGSGSSPGSSTGGSPSGGSGIGNFFSKIFGGGGGAPSSAGGAPGGAPGGTSGGSGIGSFFSKIFGGGGGAGGAGGAGGTAGAGGLPGGPLALPLIMAAIAGFITDKLGGNGLLGAITGVIPGLGLSKLFPKVFAEGGRVTGGSGMKDDVPAVLMGGEFVMRKSAVQKYGPGMMESINSGKLPGFAAGGMVGGGGDPINEYTNYRRGVNEGDRTQSGILASDWTPKASRSKEDEDGKTIDQDERVESGIVASRWTVEASIGNAKKKKTEDRIRIRTESGIESSDWTPQADYSKARKVDSNTKAGEKTEGDRTDSGIVSSPWIPKADYSAVKKPEERLRNDEFRSDSGLFSSKWTDSSNFAKQKTKDFEESNELRTQSGLASSDWTPKADVIRERENSEKTEENRTQSGLIASKFTPKADFSEVYKPDERLRNRELRSDSGSFASKWTDYNNFIKEKKQKTEDNVKFRSESGLLASDATPASGLQRSFDPKLGSVLDERLSRLRVDSSKKNNEVPALLTGGEFVMSKDSVSSFGTTFLEALNQGKLQKFAKGGLVSGAPFAREEEDFRTTDIFGSEIRKGSLRKQTGNGGYIIPGLYGEGSITGDQNLLDFSTQAFTSGNRDSTNSFAGASGISLEPESVRLTNFGRTRETPLQAATREAKGQAFGLNLEYKQQVAEYKQLLEDLKKQEKARKKAILTKLAISLITMGAQAGASGIAAAGKTAADGSTGGSFNSNVQSNGGYMKSFWGGSGGTGGVSNFSGEGSYYTKIADGYRNGSNYATGGYVTGGSSDVDSVMAMLSGGEFVLNKAATERIGQENLESLNSGGDTENSEKIVDKLDELLAATRENSGEINITVNGGGNSTTQGSSDRGQESSESKGDDGGSRAREELGKAIKLKVLEVLREEKRLGGSLR